jgi:hypothetical protein
MKIDTNRNESYIATVKMSSAKDMKWLANLKDTITENNRFNRKHGINPKNKMKVVLEGRLGSGTPSQNIKQKRKARKNSSTGAGYRITLSDAEFSDVYIKEVARG